MKRSIIFIFLSQLFIIGLFSQSSVYQKGWESFFKNDNANARNYFNQGTKDPATKAESYLGLCLIDHQEKKDKECYENFVRFYEASDNPYPYLYALSSLPPIYKARNDYGAEKNAFLEKIVEDPKMNGTLKAVLCERIGDYYSFNNKQKKALKWYDKMQTIKDWQVLGSFENISGSGFSKDWGVLEKVSQDEVFENKVDANVRWYNPGRNQYDNWFSFKYYYVFDDAIMYAQSFVNSPSNQEVYMRVGTSGSLKVWVNDALVMSISEERNCDLDIYPCKIKLNQGGNRILVQIGQSEISNANFMLRLTDENANAIEGITASAEKTSYKKATAPATTELLPFFAEEYFLNKIKGGSQNPLYEILLSKTYLRNDKAYEATKMLKTLESIANNSIIYSELLGEAYLRANNYTDYNKEMEKIKQNAPTSFIALEAKYDEAIDSEKYDEAGEICKQVKELYGESYTTEMWDVSLASYEKRMQDLVSLATKLYKKYPYDYGYMYFNYMIQKNASKNGYGATAIIQNYNKKYFSLDAINLLANVYFEEGSYEKGLVLYKNRIKKRPYATGYYNSLMYKYYHMQRYREALAISDKMMKLAPFSSSLYNMRGYIYKNLNLTSKSKESFKKAIYYNPTSYDSRKQLRLLEEKADLNELFPKNDLDELIANAPTEKDYPLDNAVVLLNDNRLIVYPEGAQETRYELAVKLLNKSAISVWKDYYISYNGNNQRLIIDNSEIIKANGSKVKAETDDDNSVVFANLEVNDVIHLEYRIQDYSKGTIAKHFFDSFNFRHTLPSIINRASVLVSKDKEFKYLVTNGEITPVITEIEDKKLYVWELNNQPGVIEEPVMSEISDIVPCLYYSSIPNWAFVSEWYKDITTSKFESDFVLKETVAEIMKGHENASQMEKAKLFYNYILENITYSNVSFLQSNFIPQKASRTITTRLGDCKDVSTLFVTLCKEEGIDANLVLVSSRNNGNVTMPLPSINFNHCIAQLNVDNKRYYLELTSNTLPFGSGISYLLDAESLPIPFKDSAMGDKLIRIKMPHRLKNSIVRDNEVTIKGNDMNIKRKTMYIGTPASWRRDSYRHIGEQEKLKKMNEAVSTSFTVPVKVTDFTFTNLDNLKDTVLNRYTVDVSGAIQDVAGMKIFKLPWTDDFSSLKIVNAETREYPIEFWSYWYEDQNIETLNIRFPNNMRFVELPKNVSLECANASYKLTFVRKASGVVVAKRKFERKTDQVSKEEYKAFREFLQKVIEYDAKQYGIK